MNKLYLPLLAFAAMLSANAMAQNRNAKGLTGYAAEAAAASQSLLQRVDTWGDWFGSTPSTPMPTSVKEYYYDNSNRLLSTLEYTNLAGDSETTYNKEKEGDHMPKQYIVYHYDANGNMVRAVSREYGTFDAKYTVWANDSSVVETNAYNDNNQIIYQKSLSQGIHAYTWEGKNLVEQNDTSYARGTWTKTTQYMDFVEGADNLPKTVLSVDAYSQKYKGVYTYDEQNRPVSYEVWQVKSATVDDAHHMTDIVLKDTPYSKEEWTYDEVGVAQYTRSYYNSSKGEYAASDGATYTTTEDGGRQCQQLVWSTESDGWGKYGSYTVDYYKEYTAGSAPANLTAAFVDGKINTISLTADLPADATDADTWKVYRNNLYLADATVADGKLTYTDADLTNNYYEYFIQRGDGNVSNSAFVNCAVELNAPQNLRVVSLTEKGTLNGTNYTLEVAWDAPEAAEGMTLKGYSVYSDLSDENPMPLNADDYGITYLTDQTYTYTWSNPLEYSHTFYVEAVYENYGRVKALPLAFRLGVKADKVLYSSGKLGDSMGNTPSDVASKLTRYYYDTKKHLVREVELSRLLGDNENTPDVVEQEGDYLPSKRYMYDYDKNGNLISKSQASYGVYQGYNFSWSDPQTIETYTYDDNNHCISKTDENYVTTYTWDGNNMTGESQSINGGAWRYNTTYSNFVEGADNLPQYSLKYGAYSSNQRIYEMTYDTAGNMLTCNTYKIAEVEKDDDGNVTAATKGDIEYAETWTYDDEGDVALYLRQKWNSSKKALEDYRKTEYVKSSKGTTETTWSYSSSTGTWTKSGLPVLNVYRDIYDNTTATNFKVTKDANKLNTVNITAGTLTDSWDEPVYYVYRNGENIGKATVSPRKTTLSFTDSYVPNGTWDYYLEADTRTSNVATTITTPVSVTFDTELQPVTNIWATGASNENSTYKMSLAWDAPETDIPIEGYNIYADVKSYTKNPAPDNGTEFLTDTKYDYSWSTEGESYRDVYVETVYVIGRVKSETYRFDAKEIIDGIDQATNIAADADFALNGRNLRVNGDYAKLSVYATSGSLCGEYAGTQSVNLSTLPQGVYVVKMLKANGQESVKKMVLK